MPRAEKAATNSQPTLAGTGRSRQIRAVRTDHTHHTTPSNAMSRIIRLSSSPEAYPPNAASKDMPRMALFRIIGTCTDCSSWLCGGGSMKLRMIGCRVTTLMKIETTQKLAKIATF